MLRKPYTKKQLEAIYKENMRNMASTHSLKIGDVVKVTYGGYPLYKWEKAEVVKVGRKYATVKSLCGDTGFARNVGCIDFVKIK